MLRRSTRLSGGSVELELPVPKPVTNLLKTMSANTNPALQRTVSASGSAKRKADDEGLVVTKKKTIKRKPTSGLIINPGPGPAPIIRSSSALGHSTLGASRPTSTLAQHPRTSHTPPTSDGESSRRPHARQPPPSPPVPAIAAARARGDSIPPVDPTPTRVLSRTNSATRGVPAPQSLNKGKGKARAPGLGLPDSRAIRPVPEEDPEILENERWMAGQRSELDARERDNQRRAGNPPVASRISALNFSSSAMGSTPVQKKPNKPRPPAPTNQSLSSSSLLSRSAHDLVEPVPISDTPVIVRNREIRQASQSRRRSSLSSRGKRASQSLSSGLLATPHASVTPDTFYRHIDPDLPDALRLRQILCWTTARAADQPSSSQPKPSPVVQDILKSVQSALTKRLASGQINTAVNAPRPAEGKPLAPNPRNIVNAQAIYQLEAYNQACQAEDSAWSELIAACNSQQATVVAALGAGSGKSEGELELDEEWRSGLEMVRGIVRGAKEGVGDEVEDGWSDEEREVVRQMKALEPKMDEAYESAYRTSQFVAKANTHLEHVFGALATTLRQRTAPPSSLVPRDDTSRMLGLGTSTAIEPIDLLRALSTRSAGPSVPSKPATTKERNGAVNGMQTVTPFNAPTPRKPPGTPRASRGGAAKGKKR